MLCLLDSILAHLPRLFSTALPVSTALPTPEDKSWSWYVNVWGVISHDRSQLYKDRVSTCKTPAQHPIYWAPTFDDAVQYLPPLPGLRKPPSALDQKTLSCFSSSTGTLIYAAENAWRHQGKKKSAVFVTLSWNDAWVRAQRWTTDYSGDWHAM
ncbi:hypothetical protein B0H14DRAFT_3519521 [Mycena olivaceomarginata]|nr:hypothetical protein B0H14DRAFT_3519521 [Mycena olivaceomarginata]